MSVRVSISALTGVLTVLVHPVAGWRLRAAFCAAAVPGVTPAGAAEPHAGHTRVQLAAPGDPAALLEALAQAPALAAARQRINAAATRLGSAGRLPDPEVEAMGSRGNMPDENRTMWELTLRQPLPKRGERAADRDRARATVAMAEADYAAAAGEIAADVALALAEHDAANARIQIMEAHIRGLDSVAQAVEARLGSGLTGRIGDQLLVQSRIATMQIMAEEERRMAEDAAAEARGRLGLPPGAPLPRFAAPEPGDIHVNRAAALRLAAARSAEADALVRTARASANPATAVGLRLERERGQAGNEDMIGLAFSSEIPWRSRGYARADVRAAEADRAAARADGEAARWRIETALSRVGRADRQAETTRRFSADTLRRLDLELDAFIRAVGTTPGTAASTTGAGTTIGDYSVLQVVEIFEKSTESELQVIQAETAARSARAELWRYAPAERLLGLIR